MQPRLMFHTIRNLRKVAFRLTDFRNLTTPCIWEACFVHLRNEANVYSWSPIARFRKSIVSVAFCCRIPNACFVRIRQKPGLHMHAARLDSGRPLGLSGDRRATTDVAMAVCAACMLLEGRGGRRIQESEKGWRACLETLKHVRL